ncbi:MAG: cytochrome c [Chloroflexi bacterium]|nr:cytochrome c [Chloroflexota bacterium]
MHLQTHRNVALLCGMVLAALFLLNACTGSGVSDDAPSKAILESGRVLYAASCQSCHGDQQGIGRLALAPYHGPDGHTWHHADGQLLEIILDGTKVLLESLGLPPSDLEMPHFRGELAREETLAVLSYIKTWWTQEQREAQAENSRRWQEANAP